MATVRAQQASLPRAYDVTLDDHSFLMARFGKKRKRGNIGIILVQHWFEELKAKVGN